MKRPYKKELLSFLSKCKSSRHLGCSDTRLHVKGGCECSLEATDGTERYDNQSPAELSISKLVYKRNMPTFETPLLINVCA